MSTSIIAILKIYVIGAIFGTALRLWGWYTLRDELRADWKEQNRRGKAVFVMNAILNLLISSVLWFVFLIASLIPIAREAIRKRREGCQCNYCVRIRESEANSTNE